MIKKTITYTDFDGNTRTEDLYFNMTKSELLEFSFNIPDTMSDAIPDPSNVDVEEAGKKLVEKLGNEGIYNFVKGLVFKAYGVKSEDGRRFVKSEQLSTEFTQTIAYDEFLMGLFSDAEKANEFINAVVPADVAKQINTNTMKVVK